MRVVSAAVCGRVRPAYRHDGKFVHHNGAQFFPAFKKEQRKSALSKAHSLLYGGDLARLPVWGFIEKRLVQSVAHPARDAAVRSRSRRRRRTASSGFGTGAAALGETVVQEILKRMPERFKSFAAKKEIKALANVTASCGTRAMRRYAQ